MNYCKFEKGDYVKVVSPFHANERFEGESGTVIDIVSTIGNDFNVFVSLPSRNGAVVSFKEEELDPAEEQDTKKKNENVLDRIFRFITGDGFNVK